MNVPRRWVHDLSELRLHKGESGFSHEALSELFENVPVAIAVTLGPDHRYAFANKLFRAGLVDYHDPVGKTLREVLGERYSPETEAPRRHVLETGEPVEIEELGSRSPYNAEETFWNIRFVPVRDSGNRVVGVLTIGVDTTEKVQARRAAERQAWEAAISSNRLALAVEATELGLWDWDAVSDKIYWSERQREIFGIAPDTALTHDLWINAIHPEDRDWVLRKVSSLVQPTSSGKLAIEYRIVRPDGVVRWISSRGRMLFDMAEGERRPLRLLGTILDITERRKNDEARQLLAQELNHRVKNLFAMAMSMVSLTARAARSPRDMAIALRGRLEALARSHELIRPALAGGEMTEASASVWDILQTVLAPHLNSYLTSDAPIRVMIEGPPVQMGAKSATAFTLVLHELATNALKYGALSALDGHLHVSYTLENGRLVLHWREANGPVITQAPQSEGFGSLLARKSVTDQLGGRIAYDWCETGLQVRLEVPTDQLLA